MFVSYLCLCAFVYLNLLCCIVCICYMKCTGWCSNEGIHLQVTRAFSFTKTPKRVIQRAFMASSTPDDKSPGAGLDHMTRMASSSTLAVSLACVFSLFLFFFFLCYIFEVKCRCFIQTSHQAYDQWTSRKQHLIV